MFVDSIDGFRSMWEALNKTRPLLLNAGIELAQMVRNQEPLNIWLPDLFLTTAKEVNVLDETIRVRPGGSMFWSRHIVATIQENGFRTFLPLLFMPVLSVLLVLSVTLSYFVMLYVAITTICFRVL